MSNCNGIELQFGGKKICLKVYYERPWWWKWPIPPEDWQTMDPRKRRIQDFTQLPLTNPQDILEVNSHLDDFISQKIIDKATLVDLVNLQHMKGIVKNLSPEYSEKLESVLNDFQEQIRDKIKIGEGLQK
ncbi:MAG TPA: hypothetical protein VGN64_21325 [Dyadobacter sp.]|jgi:hypothetical protein|nr:hypothetical protein [Dyadobacter sp.]